MCISCLDNLFLLFSQIVVKILLSTRSCKNGHRSRTGREACICEGIIDALVLTLHLHLHGGLVVAGLSIPAIISLIERRVYHYDSILFLCKVIITLINLFKFLFLDSRGFGVLGFWGFKVIKLIFLIIRAEAYTCWSARCARSGLVVFCVYLSRFRFFFRILVFFSFFEYFLVISVICGFLSRKKDCFWPFYQILAFLVICGFLS